jgi:hypothetical protein
MVFQLYDGAKNIPFQYKPYFEGETENTTTKVSQVALATY